MQGCGNDFVIIDYDDYKRGVEEQRWKDMSAAAKKLCDRNFGIGADGFIIPNTNTENTDIGWFFYNSDGTIKGFKGKKIYTIEEAELVSKPTGNTFKIRYK